MMRACGLAATVGGLLVRTAVGLVGLVIVAALVPSPPPEAPGQSEAVDSARPADSVILRVPEGELAGHLSVIDEGGRELAVLSRWRNGTTSVVASRSGGLALGCCIDADGAARLEFIGAARQTGMEIQPDGSMRTIVSDSVRLRGPVPAPGLGAPDHPRSVGRPDGASGDEASAPSHQCGLR